MATISELNRVPARYSDFKVDLEVNPMTLDLALSKNADAVKRSVRSLLTTGMYERFYRPYIGAGLQKYLFEPVTKVTAELIRQSIIATIRNHEPRALLIAARVTARPDDNEYDATVTFGIVNVPDVVTLSQIIRRAR